MTSKVEVLGKLVATRQAFGEALFEVMSEREDVVALTADLGESLRMLDIRKKIPERFLDVGVAEANMVGVAAGLALAGFVPVAGTFGVFLTRAFDHIRMQICQNNLHAIIVGSHGGVSNALDGGSAHALEDIAYMRSLPNMSVVFPGDANEMRAAVPALVDAEGPVYLRLYREPTPIYTEIGNKFVLGGAKILVEGVDVTVVATGPQTAYALEAARRLREEGVLVEVVSMTTIKPLDFTTLIKSTQKTGRVVTVEDHNINGGLGSAVAEALTEKHPAPMRRVAVEQFGESGKYEELIRKLGIDAGGIIKAVKEVLEVHIRSPVISDI